ncbi:MAG: hypothetical protein RXQ80_07560 [Sulfolobaceae archaeon]|jgi:hypothetical protein
MEIPDEVKSQLKDGVCIVCCDNTVVCMTTDIPSNLNADVDIEIDREGGDVILRNIIKDNPYNPLYLEYSIDKNFVENISKNGEIKVVFVDNSYREEATMRIKIDKDDLRIIRREVGLGA